MSYGNITVTVKCKIQLVEIILITEAAVLETTEAAASLASNVATALISPLFLNQFIRGFQHNNLLFPVYKTIPNRKCPALPISKFATRPLEYIITKV